MRCDQNPNIIFTDKYDKITRVYREKQAVAKEQKEESSLIDYNVFEIINSRRHWQATFSSSAIQNYQQYLTNSNWLGSKAGNIDQHLGALLGQIFGSEQQYARFNDILSRVLG